jgi:hypothetical protein
MNALRAHHRIALKLLNAAKVVLYAKVAHKTIVVKVVHRNAAKVVAPKAARIHKVVTAAKVHRKAAHKATAATLPTAIIRPKDLRVEVTALHARKDKP